MGDKLNDLKEKAKEIFWSGHHGVQRGAFLPKGPSAATVKKVARDREAKAREVKKLKLENDRLKAAAAKAKVKSAMSSARRKVSAVKASASRLGGVASAIAKKVTSAAKKSSAKRAKATARATAKTSRKATKASGKPILKALKTMSKAQAKASLKSAKEKAKVARRVGKLGFDLQGHYGGNQPLRKGAGVIERQSGGTYRVPTTKAQLKREIARRKERDLAIGANLKRHGEKEVARLKKKVRSLEFDAAAGRAKGTGGSKTQRNPHRTNYKPLPQFDDDDL